MEEVIDRVLEILKRELPGTLTTYNARKSASDIVKFDVPLTLHPPVRYVYGRIFNGDVTPYLQVYSPLETPNNAGYSIPKESLLHVIIEFYWESDEVEITERMLQRFKQAIKLVIENNLYLNNAAGKDAYSQWAKILSILTIDATKNDDILYNLIAVEVEYKIPLHVIEQLAGIY